MKNLKRVLSLGLASVMLLGMMVMGASAADFSDADAIQHDTAVNFMVSLGVITGNDDGTFAPERTVSRAEMATMITKALNGGTVPPLGTSSVSYDDTASHWAKNQIEYCTNLQIVSGRGNRTFDPNAAVTGSEAAKMMLTAMGYKSEWYGFTGNDWEINVNTEAGRITVPGVTGTTTLYDGLGSSFNPSAPLSRDSAAQLIYNGLRAEIVEQTSINQGIGNNADSSANYGKNGHSLLSTRFGVERVYGFMTGASFADDEFTYTLAATGIGGAALSATQTAANTAASWTPSQEVFAEDVSYLYQQKVEIVLKDDEVIGMFAADSKKVATINACDLPTMNNADATSFRVDGTTYRLQKDLTVGTMPIWNFNAAAATGVYLNAYKSTGTNKANSLDLIDIDGDNRVDFAVAHPISVAQVTFVGSTSITAGNVSYKFDDASIYEGVKKNDWAVITSKEFTGNQKAIITKAGEITGTVTATRDGEVRVDNEWYDDSTRTYTIGSEYTLTMVNGVIFNAKKNDSGKTSSGDVAYATRVDSVKAAGAFKDAYQEVELLFADGTKKVVTVIEADIASNGASEPVDVVAKSNEVKAGDLYTYSVDSDGNYTIFVIDETDYKAGEIKKTTAGSSTAITVKDGAAKGGDNANTYYFADDAIVFVTVDDNGVGTARKYTTKVLTGAEINKWGSTPYATDITASTARPSVLYTEAANGFRYVQLGVLALETVTAVPGAGGTEKYGWVTKDSALRKVGDDFYVEMTIWNGEEEVTVLADKNDIKTTAALKAATKYNKGTAISFQDLGNDEIDEVAAVGVTVGAVTGYANGDNVQIGSTILKITDKTVIVYVNTEDNTGVAGGSITLASTDASGSDSAYINNVGYKANDVNTDELDVLYVATNGNWGTKYTASAGSTSGTFSIALKGSTTSFKAGAEVTFTVTGTAAGSIKVVFGGQNEVVTFVAADVAGGSATKDVTFIMPAAAATADLKAKATVTAPAAIEAGDAVNGLTATASITSGDIYEGDTVTVTVTVSYGGTGAADTTLTLTGVTTDPTEYDLGAGTDAAGEYVFTFTAAATNSPVLNLANT